MQNILPKWITMGLGGLLLALVALLVVQKAYDLQVTFKNQKPANTISVSGEGKITVSPDMATVNIGVLTQGNGAQDVKDKNNTKINQITDFIKKQGIDPKDIATSQFNFYPTQDWSGGVAKITGYQGNQTVTVKVRNVDKDQKTLEIYRVTRPGEDFRNVSERVFGKRCVLKQKINRNAPINTQTSTARLVSDIGPFELSDISVVRAQSFPDDFNFRGTDVQYVCGMSVPPFMMQRVANAIYQQVLK